MLSSELVPSGNLPQIVVKQIGKDLPKVDEEIDQRGRLARTLDVEDQYGIEEGKSASFLMLDAHTPFEAVRQRTDVPASIRHGEYLFKRPDSSYGIGLDLLGKSK